MIQVIKYPERREWKQILQRPAIDQTSLIPSVQAIIKEVKSRGDEALLEFIEKFDKVKIKELLVSEDEINEAKSLIPNKLQDAIDTAYKNIEKFHKKQLEKVEVIETM